MKKTDIVLDFKSDNVFLFGQMLQLHITNSGHYILSSRTHSIMVIGIGSQSF